jgi:Tfp pilus assembly protein PilN
MAELDLVPSEYRRHQLLRRWLRLFALVFAAVIVLVAGARVFLARCVRAEQVRIEELRATKQVTLNQLALIEELHNRKSDAEKRLEILAGLRGGPAAEQMFVTVDRALGPDVWFESLSFRRAGELVDVPPQTVETGYFIVVPKGQQQTQERAWRLNTHMEIKGQARNHSALADFARRLVDQPEIEDVKVLKTSLRQYTRAQLVNFELAVVVESRPGGS